MNPIPTFQITRWLFASTLLLAVTAAQAQNPVTFSIDMTSQPSAAQVYMRGSFNNWGNPDVTVNGLLLTNNGAGIYSGTLDIPGSPGALQSCKVYYDPGAVWEDGADRQFVLTGGAQVLPLSAWNEKYPAPANNVTFQVDMSAQILLGRFTNAPDGYVRVAGAFNGWNASVDFTNNPAAAGNASNIYSQTLQITGFPGAQSGEYKFRAPIGDTWESINNRPSFTLTGGDQVLPLVFYNNASPCDLLATETPVTFTLSITNGTVDKDGFAFNSAVDKLYINGDFLGWWGWNTGFGGSEGPAYELTNNPVGSDLYQQTFLIPRGQSLAVTYKYSINGFDNEAGFGLNHVRYIRNSGGAPFSMPQDSFLTNSAAVRTEESFGALKVGSPSGGNIPITWLGRQCVVLQSRTNLTVGSWQDLPATEATSSIIIPATGSAQFFRLNKSN